MNRPSSAGQVRVKQAGGAPSHGLRAVVAATVRSSKLLVVGLIGAIAGAVAFVLLPPLVLERVINDLADGAGVSFGLALMYFAALALSGVFDSARESLIVVFGQRVTRGLRSRMCAKLDRLPAGYFNATDAGVTVSRFVNDVDTVDALFASGVISMFVDACTVISIVAVIFTKSLGLGLLLVLVTPLLFVLTRQFQKRMLAAQMDNRVAVGNVSNHVPETIRTIRMVHVFGKERYMERRYADFIEESYNAVTKSNFYDSIYSPIILVVSALVVASMMVLAASGGAMQQLFGMSVGSAVAVIAYVGRVFNPLQSIGMEIQNIQSAVAGVRRINEFLSEPEQPQTSVQVDLQEVAEPCVSFDQVSFSYDGTTSVVSDFCLQVARGEHVTLVGRTGAGKSTLFKLILGLYKPQVGEVRVFGQPATELAAGQRRALFGYVEQSFYLVPGTVSEQITLFDEHISPSQVYEAARMVGLYDVIAGLTDGFETPCVPGLFSQGQLQLLSIARAVVANPVLLLLDEITANLDASTEAQVLDALHRASQHRTVISISHRLLEVEGCAATRVVEIG